MMADGTQTVTAGTLTARDQVIRQALLRVASNVAKHCIQRSGWSEGDECFQVDLTQSELDLRAVVRAAEAEMRERCATLAESHVTTDDKDIHVCGWDACCADEQGPAIAARIRALNGD